MTPISGPKSIVSFQAGLRASGKSSTAVTTADAHVDGEELVEVDLRRAHAACSSPMTFIRRSSAFIANARVSATETPNSVCSSSSPSIHGGLQHAVGDRRDLDERALDRLDVARVAARHVAQEARAERDVAVLVARDLGEALDEARQRPHPLVVVHDEVLAGEGEHALDDHVVDRHRLDQRLEVLGLDRQPVDARVQHLVEEDAELAG